jgi:hypothetical protein
MRPRWENTVHDVSAALNHGTDLLAVDGFSDDGRSVADQAGDALYRHSGIRTGTRSCAVVPAVPTVCPVVRPHRRPCGTHAVRCVPPAACPYGSRTRGRDTPQDNGHRTPDPPQHQHFRQHGLTTRHCSRRRLGTHAFAPASAPATAAPTPVGWREKQKSPWATLAVQQLPGVQVRGVHAPAAELSKARQNPSRPSVTAGQLYPSNCPGGRTREDGLDGTCRAKEVAAIGSMDASGQGRLTLNRQSSNCPTPVRRGEVVRLWHV